MLRDNCKVNSVELDKMLAKSCGEFFLLMLTEPQATFILKLVPIMQLLTLLRANFPLLMKVPSEINALVVAAAIRKQKSSIRKACILVILSMTFYLFFWCFPSYFALLCPDVLFSLSILASCSSVSLLTLLFHSHPTSYPLSCIA